MKAAHYLRVPPLDFLEWPARWLWIAAESSKLEAEEMQLQKRNATGLSHKLKQRNRPGGAQAFPLFPDSNA